MLEQVLAHLKNWFQVGIYSGTYTIRDGGIALPFLQDGQYFRICGSIFNNGLHRYTAPVPPEDPEPLEDGDVPPEEPDPPPEESPPDVPEFTDETFTGTIWALAVPRAVIALAEEIDAWQEKNGAAVQGPYSSESFGGYSYTRAVDGDTGDAVTWEKAFMTQLDRWRKVREI